MSNEPKPGPATTGDNSLDSSPNTHSQKAGTTATTLPRRNGVLKKLLMKRLSAIGLVVLGVVFLAAIFAPLLAPYGYLQQDVLSRFQTPSLDHLLGTDELGRDIFSRILFGARYSLVMGLSAVALSFVIGVLLGAVAGFFPKSDSIIMRCIDIIMAFPGILLAIAIVAALGPGLLNIIIAIGVNDIPGFARITRSLVLSIREQEYVTAARVTGANESYIMRRHVLINLISPLTVYGSLQVSTAVMAGATLSFLGLGIQPPTPEWGAMVSTAREYLAIAPHTFIFPTIAILITVVSFNLVGDGLRDALDPRL